MQTYGWNYHNGIDFGEEEILDTYNNLHLTISFIKNINENFGIFYSIFKKIKKKRRRMVSKNIRKKFKK